jgi:hypothetical protein
MHKIKENKFYRNFNYYLKNIPNYLNYTLNLNLMLIS